MKVKVFKAAKKGRNGERFYLLVSSDVNFAKILQKAEVSKLGELIEDKVITINKGEKRIAIDSDEAIEHIEANGFYIQGVKITSTVGG